MREENKNVCFTEFYLSAVFLFMKIIVKIRDAGGLNLLIN